MLNLVCHLSGIATTTAAVVDAVEGTKARSATPEDVAGTARTAEVAVARRRGSQPQDGPRRCRVIKDNHVAAAGSVVAALRAVRASAPELECEVEVDSLEQLDEVLV